MSMVISVLPASGDGRWATLPRRRPPGQTLDGWGRPRPARAFARLATLMPDGSRKPRSCAGWSAPWADGVRGSPQDPRAQRRPSFRSSPGRLRRGDAATHVGPRKARGRREAHDLARRPCRTRSPAELRAVRATRRRWPRAATFAGHRVGGARVAVGAHGRAAERQTRAAERERRGGRGGWAARGGRSGRGRRGDGAAEADRRGIELHLVRLARLANLDGRIERAVLARLGTQDGRPGGVPRHEDGDRQEDHGGAQPTDAISVFVTTF